MELLSYLSIGISTFALFIALFQILIIRKHNELSLRPIGFFKFGNYEDDLYIKLMNYGVGPLIIEKFSVNILEGSKNVSYGTVVHYVTLDNECNSIIWNDYVENIDGRTIPAGGEITLLRYRESGMHKIDPIRKRLAKGELSIIYKNAYNTKQDEVKRKMDFFGGTM